MFKNKRFERQVSSSWCRVLLMAISLVVIGSGGSSASANEEEWTWNDVEHDSGGPHTHFIYAYASGMGSPAADGVYSLNNANLPFTSGAYHSVKFRTTQGCVASVKWFGDLEGGDQALSSASEVSGWETPDYDGNLTFLHYLFSLKTSSSVIRRIGQQGIRS